MTRRSRQRELPALTAIAFTPGQGSDVEAGLLGYVRFVVDDLIEVDGVTVRRTRRGHVALSFPKRENNAGERHAVVRPKNDRARLVIEQLVFDRLKGLLEVAP